MSPEEQPNGEETTIQINRGLKNSNLNDFLVTTRVRSSLFRISNVKDNSKNMQESIIPISRLDCNSTNQNEYLIKIM